MTAELLPTVARIVSIFAEKKLAKRVESPCVPLFCGRRMFVAAGGRSLNDTVVLNCPRIAQVCVFPVRDRFCRNARFNPVDNKLDPEVIGEKR